MEIKKIFIVLALMAISATALILAGIYIADNVSFGADGLTSKQKAEAVNITLSDYFIHGILDNTDTMYDTGIVKQPDAGYYTYSNESRSLAVVPLHYKNPYVEQNLSVTVDLEKGKVVSIYLNNTSQDITYQQQMDAIKTAISDAYIKGWMNDLAAQDAKNNNYGLHYDEYMVWEVRPSSFNEYGYVDQFGFYVDVPLQIGSPAPMMIQYMLVTVDLADHKVKIKKHSYGEMLMGSTVYATIPPGKSFYREYYARMNVTLSNYPSGEAEPMPIQMVITQQPDDVSIRPLIVDQENLKKLLNGSSFSELTNASHITNGSRWSISIPADSEFYLVLKNEDTKRAVDVTIPYRPF